MTIREIAAALSLRVLNEGQMDREVAEGYCGDLLSWVMGRAPHGCIWVTIMSNRNVIAVAALAEISAVLFAEDVVPDADALEKAQEENITLLASDRPVFELVGRLYTLMGQPT